MRTLNLRQAADLLHMHKVTLLLKAQSGEIPAAKPAKCWVFIEQDIQDYLRGFYRTQKNSINSQLTSIATNKIEGSKRSYYQSLGITDYPQIHSPQRDSRSGARHADEVNQVAEGEAVGLVVNSVNMTQSKTRVMQGA
jgi:hypothetical protein